MTSDVVTERSRRMKERSIGLKKGVDDWGVNTMEVVAIAGIPKEGTFGGW